MPRKDNFNLPPELGTLTPTEWDAKGRAAVLAWQPMAERYRRADTYTRGRKHQPLLLGQVHPDRWPLLAAYLAEHPNTSGYDGWPPTITRSHAARLGQMQAMQAQHGPLVLLRLDLGALDALPLHSAELVGAARSLIDELHAELLHPGTPYTLSIQRASRTHAHAVVPLSGFLAGAAALVLTARPGAGGGCLLLAGRAHTVVIDDDEEDLEKVARYVTRDPDARLDVPDDSDDYFDALEAVLVRKQQPGHRRVRLGWKGTTPSKRLTLAPVCAVSGPLQPLGSDVGSSLIDPPQNGERAPSGHEIRVPEHGLLNSGAATGGGVFRERDSSPVVLGAEPELFLSIFQALQIYSRACPKT